MIDDDILGLAIAVISSVGLILGARYRVADDILKAGILFTVATVGGLLGVIDDLAVRSIYTGTMGYLLRGAEERARGSDRIGPPS